jgi:hypothetical protein
LAEGIAAGGDELAGEGRAGCGEGNEEGRKKEGSCVTRAGGFLWGGRMGVEHGGVGVGVKAVKGGGYRRSAGRGEG